MAPDHENLTFLTQGISYIEAGDYENARASFLSGEYQDTMSESEEFCIIEASSTIKTVFLYLLWLRTKLPIP